MRSLLLPTACLLLLPLATGCNPTPRSQEEVRRDTANATATIKSDLKGAAAGIRDGLHRDITHDAVDVNTASRTDLEALPGVTPAMAAQVVAHRPYAEVSDLRKRRILPKDVYDNVSGRLTASR